MAQVTVRVHRKEGPELAFRISQEKLDIRVAGDWLILNEKSGKIIQQPVPGGIANVEEGRTFCVCPAWNVLDVKVSQGDGMGSGVTDIAVGKSTN